MSQENENGPALSQDAGLSAPSSTIDWDVAFQSPTFCSSLQAAVAAAVTQTRESRNDDRVNAFERLGDQLNVPSGRSSRTSVSAVSTAFTVAPREAATGMLTVPSFIGLSGSSSLTQSRATDSTFPNVNVPTLLGSCDRPVVSLGPLDGLNQPFILGPGRPPIPSKIISQILDFKFIEMHELIPENLENPSNEVATFVFDGRSIVPTTASSTRKKGDNVDIITWVECFTSFLSVMTTYHPARARDLLAYMALIIRIAKQFPGRCWYNYDRAFRLHAAASNLTNWSQINPDSYHYHTSVAVQTSTPPSSGRHREPRGDQYATTICKSWNSGACSSPREFCRFRHRCDRSGCGGSHRRINCHESTSKRARSPGDESRRYRPAKRD